MHQPAQGRDLRLDLGVGAAHGRHRVDAAERFGHRRVEEFLLGLRRTSDSRTPTWRRPPLSGACCLADAVFQSLDLSNSRWGGALLQPEQPGTEADTQAQTCASLGYLAEPGRSPRRPLG